MKKLLFTLAAALLLTGCTKTNTNAVVSTEPTETETAPTTTGVNINYDFYAKLISQQPDLANYYAGYELTDDPAVIKINCKYPVDIAGHLKYEFLYESNHNLAAYYEDNNGVQHDEMIINYTMSNLKFAYYVNIEEGTVNGASDSPYLFWIHERLVTRDHIYFHERKNSDGGITSTEAYVYEELYHDGNIKKDEFYSWFMGQGLTEKTMLKTMYSLFEKSCEFSLDITYDVMLGNWNLFLDPDKAKLDSPTTVHIENDPSDYEEHEDEQAWQVIKDFGTEYLGRNIKPFRDTADEAPACWEVAYTYTGNDEWENDSVSDYFMSKCRYGIERPTDYNEEEGYYYCVFFRPDNSTNTTLKITCITKDGIAYVYAYTEQQ